MRPPTAAAAAPVARCAGWSRAGPNPSRNRPRPRLSSSGSSRCASRVVGALASGEAAEPDPGPHGAWTVRIRSKEDPVVSQGEKTPTVTSDDVAGLPLVAGVEDNSEPIDGEAALEIGLDEPEDLEPAASETDEGEDLTSAQGEDADEARLESADPADLEQ